MPHIHELIDFTASAFIVHEDKVLLVHHKKLDSWLQIGGHIELDEDPDTALMREIEEECGLEVEVLSEKAPCKTTDVTTPQWRPHFVNLYQITDTHQHVDMVYVCRAKTTDFTLEEKSHHDMGWFTAEETKDLKMFDNTRELVLASLDIAAKAG